MNTNASTSIPPIGTSTLPASLYASLLPKLVAVLELTQAQTEAEHGGSLTPQAKQAILHATNDFKTTLARARDLATNLPGGELLIREQDDVIDMLVELRDRKRQQLAEFATRTEAISERRRMDVDSMASTPSP